MNLPDILSTVGIDAGMQSLLSGSHNAGGATVTTQVQGLQELETALNNLPEVLARGAIRRAVKLGSDEFKARAIEYAPFDPNKKMTGKHPMHLMDGIRVAITMRSDSVKGTSVRGKIGLAPEVFYGRILESNWTHVGGEQIAGIHWMLKAFEVGKNFALLAFESELKTGLDAAVHEVAHV